MSQLLQSKARGANLFNRLTALLAVIMAAIIVAACSNLPPAPTDAGGATPFYRIGPGDALNVFVWQNTQLSTPAIVGPDGRISLPLIKDMEAAGKTPTQLARDIENRLTKYVTDPVVTVMVSSYVGPFSQQVRVIGEVGKPQALVYRKGMTVLDAMLAVGGLTPYAAGSRATLVRTWRDTQTSYGLRLDKLMQDGDLSANAPLEPGDVITVPQTYF